MGSRMRRATDAAVAVADEMVVAAACFQFSQAIVELRTALAARLLGVHATLAPLKRRGDLEVSTQLFGEV